MFELSQDAAAPAVETNDKQAFSELGDLQLALVGGGVGVVLWG